MKRIFKIFLSLVLTIALLTSFTACDSNSEEKNDDTPKEKQVWLPYKIKNVQQNTVGTYYYNEYGNVVKIVSEDENGNWQAEWINEYDENQNLIKTSIDTGDGTPFVQLIQTYDDKGNLIERREINTSFESIYTYQYDNQNRIISRSSGDMVIETYTYESDGSYKAQDAVTEEEYILYRADGQIKELHISSNTKVIYDYNQSGVLLGTVTYSGGKETQRTVRTIDENGNAIKSIEKYPSGVEIVLTETEYKLYTVKTS